MTSPTTTIELPEDISRCLEALTHCSGVTSVEDVLERFVYSTVEGVCRHAAWEREWVDQAFGTSWHEHLDDETWRALDDAARFPPPLHLAFVVRGGLGEARTAPLTISGQATTALHVLTRSRVIGNGDVVDVLHCLLSCAADAASRSEAGHWLDQAFGPGWQPHLK